MEQQQSNYIKSLNILFNALVTGQALFALVAYALVATGNFKSTMPGVENIFVYVVAALLIGGRFGGTMLYKTRLQQAIAAPTITEKLNLYRAAFLIRCALLEGPVLFAIITYLLTNATQLIILAAFGILLFLTLKPVKEKIAKELEISVKEIE
ncbi:hypothetical protein BH11BAC6_BH11BAC6_14540 [soil metagenome]